MNLSIQDTHYKADYIYIEPILDVTCLNCNRTITIAGEPIQSDDGSIIASDIEESISNAMTGSGWQSRICPSCISHCPDLPRLYNSPDQHDED